MILCSLLYEVIVPVVLARIFIINLPIIIYQTCVNTLALQQV